MSLPSFFLKSIVRPRAHRTINIFYIIFPSTADQRQRINGKIRADNEHHLWPVIIYKQPPLLCNLMKQPTVCKEDIFDDSLWWIHPTSREFYTKHIFPSGAVRIKERARLLRFSLGHAWAVKKKNHLAQFLEFGVHEGRDLVRMAHYLSQLDSQTKTKNTHPTIMHGFDSFRGLPEDWDNGQTNGDESLAFAAGKFSLDGVAPVLSSVQEKMNLGFHKGHNNASTPAKLHPGWFSDTVPSFLQEYTAPIAFLHADADLYGSTMTFLDEICKNGQLIVGTVINFDEYTNYQNWQDGEYRAWKEICETYNVEFQYIGYHAPAPKDPQNQYGYQSVSIVVTSIGK